MPSFDKSIPHSSVQASDLTRDPDCAKDSCIRVYTSAPDQVTLQLRSYGSTNQRRGGVPHHIVSSVGLTAFEAQKVVDALQYFIRTKIK